ncbi:DUF1850 domain-containing protein [Halomonas caseinilytica]|uniref:DUF1850 domain-containing protein n=1 Tax=Halomonas caseinilytica TaxID=438744 RepID=A0A1M6V1D1_9GAMM|nr:DUF1850 domain-containing protein [Halomonas caseinilytica]SHK75214.1 protein of unknown function [Halomonas caseinilytica]
MRRRMHCVAPGRARRGPALLLCLACLLLPVPALAECPAHELRVNGADGRLLVSLPMPEGAGWCLAWNHSVEGFAVHDCYRNVGGHMVLERSHLPDFAAGLDHIPGRGRQVSDGQGGYWIEDLDEPVPGDRYRLRVGAMRVDHRLVRHGEPSLRALLERSRTRGCRIDERLLAEDGPVVISLSELAANEGVTIGLYTNP